MLVYLFGESAVHLSVEGLCSVSVQELGRSVRETLCIPESAQDAFAFWLCSPLLGKNFFCFLFFYQTYTLISITTYMVEFLFEDVDAFSSQFSYSGYKILQNI